MSRQVHAGEAQKVSMLHHEDERDDAGPALRRVEPVARPWVIANVGLALIPDVDAIEAVVEDRNPDEEQFEEKNSGQAVQKLDLLAVGDGTFEGFSVRNEVLEKKGPDGDDAADGMQTAQQERSALSSAQWSDARFDLRNGGIGSCCHDDYSLRGPICKLVIIGLRATGSQGEIDTPCGSGCRVINHKGHGGTRGKHERAVSALSAPQKPLTYGPK